MFLFCSRYDKHSHYISDAEDAKIVETNLRSMEVSLGDSVNLTCRSTGKPEPETFWYKVGTQTASHSMYKVFKHNCSTLISMDDCVQPQLPCTDQMFYSIKHSSDYLYHLNYERVLISPYPDQEGNKLQRPNSGFIQHNLHEAQYTS